VIKPTEEAEESLPFDIAIVGLGIVGIHQVTREVEETIRRCRQTFVVDSGFGIIPYLESLCPVVTDLIPLYKTAKTRMETYQNMALEVTDAAIENPPICFATYGHPLIYCYPATLIRQAASLLNLQVEIFPGICSLATLLVDLGIDAATDGLQMYEATDLVVRRRFLQNDTPCIIWQVDVFADATYKAERKSAEVFLPLQNYLLEFYPPDHLVTLVLSKTFPLQRSVIRTYRVGSLALDLASGQQVGTLYIPPTQKRPIVNWELFSRLAGESSGGRR
jgi:uncharacterized protein YabN with tetrapyrrole methylase and pyrophosphatase domain